MHVPKEYPTLKFPERQTLSEAQFPQLFPQTGGEDKGFAAAYYAALEKIEKEEYGRIGHYDAGNEELYILDINRAHDNIRRRISAEMQEYLIRHNGEVDIWPDSQSMRIGKLSTKNYDNDTESSRLLYQFDYFGSDYKAGILPHRKKKGFVYRNGYVGGSYDSLDEYFKLETEAKYLKKQADKADEQAHGFLGFISLLGIPYFIFGLLCIAGCIFFGAGDKILELETAIESVSDKPLLHSLLLCLYIIIFLPGILAAWISTLSGKIYWILLVLLVLVCLAGAVFCPYFYRELHGASREAKAARKAYHSLVEREDYIHLKKENAKRVGEQAAADKKFAEEWHRAWYNWICSVRKAPADEKELEKAFS